MKRIPFRRVVAVAAVAVGAVLLSACSGSSTSNGAATSSAGAAISSAAEAVSPGGAASGSAAPDSAASLHDQLPQAIQDAGVLRVAADNHPPYRTTAPDGSVTGIDADLWAALGKELGIEVQYEQAASLPAILTGLNSGRYDAYNGPLAATAEREEALDMIAWIKNDVSYLYPADRTVEGIADVCGKNVGHGVGNVIEQMLPKLGEWCVAQGKTAPTGLPLNDTSSTVLALTSGQVDFAAMTESAAIDIMAAQEGKYDYVVQDEKQGGQTFMVSLVTPRGTGLSPVMLEAFERIFANGEYEKVIQNWNLERVQIDEPVINPVTGRTP